MKKKILSLRLGRAVTVVAMLVGAVGFAQQAVAGIAATKHNLGSTGSSTNNKTSGTDEICVFCHTPHAANTAMTAAPLWNKALPGAQTFTLYNSTGTSGSMEGKAAAVGSISIACLSCHDGASAMDNMINKPGSGGYVATSGSQLGGTWSGNVAAGVLGAGVTNIGTDLSNDHPIGIPYCGGGITGNSVTGCADADFYGSTANGSRLSTTLVNGSRVWWVDTGTADAARQKTDMILYTRADLLKQSDGSTLPSGPSVECGSCHDPHSSNNTFLRIANTGSAVCLACHVK